VKTPEQVLDDVERRLARTWASCLAAEPTPPPWPHAFPLGQPTSVELTEGFAAAAKLVGTWRSWAGKHGLALTVRTRRVMGTDQELPTHVTVPDVDTAARLCANGWPARLQRGRVRAAALTSRFPHLGQPERLLSAIDGLTATDFDLLCRAADWFASHDAAGLTPRQVPIEGMHAKWLNTRQALVRELAGVESLGLAPRHPARIHFTYLDPGHRAAGGRVHDSATVGDRIALPYRPQVVVISENKDTAIHFPCLVDGVSIEGVGRGGASAAAFDWIVNARAVFYWGDMDADGLEILDGFRQAGVPATSVLMNQDAYARWERFGTSADPGGRSLAPRKARPVPHLTLSEAGLYHQLISPAWVGHRRIEQERIPLTVALAEIHHHLSL
jgi:hypothetical protein